MKTPYTIVPSLADVTLDKSKPLALDIETCGIYGKIRLVQLYQQHWPEVIMVEWPDPILLQMFCKDVLVVAHNIHYEETTMQTHGSQDNILANKSDTFLAARLAIPNKEKYALDNVMQYVLGFDPYEKQGLDKKLLQKSNWDVHTLSEDQLLYASTDVYYLLAVYNKVKTAEDNISYHLDKLMLDYCLDFQWNGMPIDKARFFAKYDEVQAEVDRLSAMCACNPNSYKQVREWLGVADGTDDLGLAYMELDEAHPRRDDICWFGSTSMTFQDAAAWVRKSRKARKQLSFLAKFEDTALEGNIYGKFKPSARSGRLTSDDQNLQQIPRSLKEVFGVAEDSGEILIYADYAQIELRHICAITKCRRMEELFRTGEDLHTYTADMLFGSYETLYDEALREALDVAQKRRGELITQEEHDRIAEGVAIQTKKLYKRYRQISKTCNFSLLYGGGIPMFIGILIKTANILLTELEANRTRSKWRNLWEEIYAWQQRGISAWKNGRLGSTPLGRKYSAKMMTDQLNIENQGGAADVNKLAMHYLYKRLKPFNEANNCNYRVANNIHDSFILRGPNNPELYQQVAAILAEEMQRAWFECSKSLAIKDLPMPVDVICGYNWGDIETDDFDHPYTFTLEPYKMLEEV